MYISPKNIEETLMKLNICLNKLLEKYNEIWEKINPKTAGGQFDPSLIPPPVVFRKLYLLKRG